jgi:hypothetical protein
LYAVNRASCARITANIAAASTASTENAAAGSDNVAATKPSTRNPQITAPDHPYGQRGGLTGSSGTPGRFRACSCTTSASFRAVETTTVRQVPRGSQQRRGTVSAASSPDTSRRRQRTAWWKLSRTQKVPSMRMRMLSVSSTSCCAIPITNPAAQASRNQGVSPAQTDAIPASNARTTTLASATVEPCVISPPRCWLDPILFSHRHLVSARRVQIEWSKRASTVGRTVRRSITVRIAWTKSSFLPIGALDDR